MLKNNKPKGEKMNKKTLLNKEIKIVKKQYIKSKMTEHYKNLKFLKNHNKIEKCNSPDKILYNQVMIYSPKVIANIANNFCLFPF